MASRAFEQPISTGPRLVAALRDREHSIGTPAFDALLLWGAPLIALATVVAVAALGNLLPGGTRPPLAHMLLGLVAILTYAHLFAVVPRAYLNADVFGSNRRRLTIVPAIAIAGLVMSPVILAVGIVLAVFWDVHHSAMQNFGLARIYDMKVGNDPHVLRATDLRLNWMLYVGPLAAGAALMSHIGTLGGLHDAGLDVLANAPGAFEHELPLIREVAVSLTVATTLWVVRDYRAAMRQGYRLPPHKIALTGSAIATSIMAWGFLPPVMAFAVMNIFHAVQYFALVWLKEGKRMAQFSRLPADRAMIWFLGMTVAGGTAYEFVATGKLHYLIGPFVAVSLLHFWFDSFVWSVRKRQV